MSDPPVHSPVDAAAAARLLDTASEDRQAVLFRGGGAHQGYGYRVAADLIVSTDRLDRIVDWAPEDLTAVVEAGVRVADLEAQLAAQGQTAVFPETPGDATVGGVVAAGISGWRRLRYGPTRDRILEVVVATGDGRAVRGGGRVVKNVTGYDLPRLATGSFGSLGLITQVALKLWPLASHSATVAVDDAEKALATAFRPLAVVEDDGQARVYLAGTEAEVRAQAADLGGDATDGLQWPEPLDGRLVLVLRVPPGLTRQAVDRLPGGWRYQAAFGVGEVRIGAAEADVGALAALRAWAASFGGALVVEQAPDELYREFDPWGDAGPSVDLQRRVKAAFDPLGVCNPGRLPGGL